MINKKTIIPIVTIVAIVAAGITAFVVLNDEKEDSEIFELKVGDYVPIFGNVNNDLYINEKDVQTLQQLIDDVSKNGPSAWNKEKMPFADANCDGVIDSNDVEIVKKIMNKETCKVYYKDYFGDATEVSFPMKNRNIAVTYYQQAEACAILGVLDDIKVASKAATVYGTMWPHLKSTVEWGTTGSSAITDDAVEKFIQNGINLVVCTPRIENKELGVNLHQERGIDFIQLWYNGNHCIPTIQTMGILMDREDKSQAYMDYCNGVAEKLTSKITDKNAKNILVMSGYDSDTDKISVLANERHGSRVLIDKYLGNCYYEMGENQFGFVYHNIEWAIENGNRFDYIVFCMSGNSGYADDQSTGAYYTKEAYNTKFEGAVSYFSKVPAHDNGNIVGSVYPNTFGFSAYAFLELIAAQLYPDLFTLDEGIETLQAWFDNYNVVDIDVRTQGPVTYTGTAYKTNYPQL